VRTLPTACTESSRWRSGNADLDAAVAAPTASSPAYATRALSIPSGDRLRLGRIAEAHDHVDAGTRKRVLLAITS
jgi:hypothetical protein